MDLDRPLVLVSGGPDSVALLRVILALGGEPAVLHVDHGLRGEGSQEDAEFVRGLCEGLGLRCKNEHVRRGTGSRREWPANWGRGPSLSGTPPMTSPRPS